MTNEIKSLDALEPLVLFLSNTLFSEKRNYSLRDASFRFFRWNL